MTASWAGVLISSLSLIGTLAVLLWRDGHNAGRVDTAIEKLTDITKDHEARIRVQEGRPWAAGDRERRHRGGP
jgi:hypothetical protein